MDFQFTEEQLMIQDIARRIGAERIAPIAAEFDQSGEFPMETIKVLGENGLMGIEVPAEYGGAGMDSIAYALAMIEIAAADCAHSTIMSVNNTLYCNGLLKYGSEAQKHRYVTPIATGQAIGAFALTEPQSGSDAASMRTRAVASPDGSYYTVNGKKSWITSGPVAKYIMLFAMTDPTRGAKGISAFMIDTEREGFHRGKTEPKLGIRASATCEIEFTDYVVGPEDVLGKEGEGFKIAMGVLDAGRIGIASQAIGIARAAYEAPLAYVTERKAFGAPIGTFQPMPGKLADMYTTLSLCCWYVYAVARACDAGRTTRMDAAGCILLAAEKATQVALDGIQALGGTGYITDYPTGRILRDAKLYEIGAGTSEIRRMLIGRELYAATA